MTDKPEVTDGVRLGIVPPTPLAIFKHKVAKRQLYALTHTDTRKEWEEPGEMTIRRTSKPCIGGATLKRDRADSATDERQSAAAAVERNRQRKVSG